jgi:hypothetical protein
MNHREIVEFLEENTAGDVKNVVLISSGNAWCDWHCGNTYAPTHAEQAYSYVARALRAAGYVSHLANAHEVIRRRHGRQLSPAGLYLRTDLAERYSLVDCAV